MRRARTMCVKAARQGTFLNTGPQPGVLLLDELPEFSRSVLEGYGSVVGETWAFPEEQQ